MDDSHIWHMETKLVSQLVPNKAFIKVELGEDSRQWLTSSHIRGKKVTI